MVVERIDYQAGSVKGKGALVWNEKISGKRPLLLVMPNWLGVTELAIKSAQKMAGDNISPSSVACTAKDESASNAALNTLVAEADKRGIGDSTKKAAVGFCFGGGNILEHDFIQDAFNKKL